jgi:hypothetical protein
VSRPGSSLLSVAALLVCVSASAAEPPPPTLAQLGKALARSDPKTAGRAMNVKTRAIVAKPSGGEREEIASETFTRGDGTSETKILLATKDGKDVTAEKRAEQAKKDAGSAKEAKAPKDSGEHNRKVSLGLKVPTGDDRKLFVFGEPAAEGSLLVAAYEPVRGAKGADLSRGRIAWNADSGEPAWIEARYVDLPTGLKEFLLRGEFAGAGDAIYTRVLRTTGVGGLLWIRRTFDVTVEMTPSPVP